ncbi:ectoine/hydroxyectoine ABC transporter ATP-binding protein EhuA [Haematobacter genomosp. 1]|uniref:Ectoine/hydroxyectoine ABC transporter ATP-binding protein EhuA n=1 Tax=Haematobacter genomosp. 1 TaxID=366618 RepID=A0A212A6Z5_9RHOB|nr:amino acid ABC transporter ATP-binding protein [Haematobacter genomosp. 1]OWJ74801.1 ectoine/hydroxyectoine ABC transporter ATP-binding protein EhuA [Haematobacter genomosp. 1]
MLCKGALPDVLIAARGISKSFGQVEVLHDVSLDVRAGEVVCVIGPSGSGKTTLLRCMALLEEPSSGEVTLKGVVISDSRGSRQARAAARAVRPEIGLVFQHFNLWPHMTVLGNVIEAPMRVRGLSREAATTLAMDLLRKVGLEDKADRYPARLSGGQQQRVAIARALAMQPSVLMFDEATSALDPELRQEVLQVMRDLAREGMTMLVVTHEMGFARNVGDRLVFMDQGRIVEDTQPETFFTNPRSERAARFLRQIQD